ncbi:MAG: outer membrane beta-barrel protein [Rikenellaceae bacterium]
MVKKLLLTLCLLSSTSLFAQLRVGVSSGVTLNNLDCSSGWYYDREYQTASGFSVAIPVQYDFKEWFSVKVEPSYMKKNYTDYRQSLGAEITSKNGFLQLPAMAQFSVGGEKLRGYTSLGAYIGYWSGGSTQGEYYNIFSGRMDFITAEYEFNSTRDNRFDGGVLCGLGIEYLVCNNIYINAETRLLYGLTDMQKEYMLYQYPRYNTTFVFELGVSYKFNK